MIILGEFILETKVSQPNNLLHLFLWKGISKLPMAIINDCNLSVLLTLFQLCQTGKLILFFLWKISYFVSCGCIHDSLLLMLSIIIRYSLLRMLSSIICYFHLLLLLPFFLFFLLSTFYSSGFDIMWSLLYLCASIFVQ